MRLMLGGISNTYIPEMGSREMIGAVPTQQQLEKYGMQYSVTAFYAWLMRPDLDTDTIIRMFGHFPTYQEWADRMRAI